MEQLGITVFDVAVIAVAVFGAAIGMSAGFAHALLFIGSWFVAGWIALNYSQLIEPEIMKLVQSAELARFGGSADRDGTTLGTLHQRWMDLKASIAGNDDKAVINEVERGEDYLKEKFEAAMSSDALEGSFRGVVERAYGSVREGHDRVSALKHSLDANINN